MSRKLYPFRQLREQCPATDLSLLSDPPVCNRDSRRGLSLVELLVVMAIMALLMAILLPALSQVKHRARRSACAANLRQVGVPIHLYPSLAAFQVKTRTSHQRTAGNVLFAAGHVKALSNRDDEFTVDIGNVPYDGLERILDMFKAADDYG